jgi:hypothetical protein
MNPARLIPILLVVLLAACDSQRQSPPVGVQKAGVTVTTEDPAVKAASEAKAKAAADAAKKEQEAKKAKLLKDFNKDVDKFTNDVTYRHKSMSKYWNCGTTLNLKLQDGTLLLQSSYNGSDWIFHDHFIVKIGEVSKEYTGRNKHEVINHCDEAVFLDAGDSKSLVEFIATADPKLPVMVRLVGHYRKDFQLSAEKRKGIIETWELSKILK